ncbi:MAG: fatty acid desaturase [Chitinophagaceae bacterium]|nr:fatty acid desaturase [Chitinophagaceae bacterium]
MKDKHIHIAADSELLGLIKEKVRMELSVDSAGLKRLLWLKFVFYFSLVALTYSMIWRTNGLYWFILAFILYGFFAVLFAFNFAHDFSHNTVFKNRKWNNYCFIFIYTLVGAHAEAWKHRHIHSHHYAPNVEDYDSDLQISDLIRVIPGSPHRWYHRVQHIYAPVVYTTYSLFWVFIKDFVILFSKNEYEQSHSFRYHVSFWLQKVVYFGYLLILPLLFSGQKWYIVVIAFIAMHLFQSLFLLFTFFMTHHVESTAYPVTDDKGYITTSWLMNQVKSSNDFYPFSKTANFIFGGFNNHVAHHLFPNIHHACYPEISYIIYKVLCKRNIYPNQTTFWGGIRSHLRFLKRMSAPG